MTDPYATAEESAALIQQDTRTPYMKMLDQMMDVRGANEQGADVPKILYQIAVDLLAALYHDTEEQP
jgi:hypothetical protein